jgi:hypothetical protein
MYVINTIYIYMLMFMEINLNYGRTIYPGTLLILFFGLYAGLSAYKATCFYCTVKPSPSSRALPDHVAQFYMFRS